MDKILLLDTSVATANRGDDIIMECCRTELSPLLSKSFELTLPTHVPPFHWYQVWRNSLSVQRFANCKYKFACGTNLLIPRLLTHYPQWNINLFNYQPLKGTVLLGVGAGAGAEGKIQKYTKYIYARLLNRDLFHSVRDERSKKYVERLGLKVINTGCVTMWMLTPDHCSQIPVNKSRNVIFTLTAASKINPDDQKLIDILSTNYENIYFWPQGDLDYDYLSQFYCPKQIKCIEASKDAYHRFLLNHDVDYVGTRLHGGIYAIRHKKRSVIIAIDERASAISKDTNLNCISHSHIENLEQMINGPIVTDIRMPFDKIQFWKNQFAL